MSNNNVISDDEFIVQLKTSNKKKIIQPDLAHTFVALVRHVSKNAKFRRYSYREDMEQYALMQLVTTWKGFDSTKSSAPNAYFTRCVYNSYLQYIKKETRQDQVRDEHIIDVGLLPSWSYKKPEVRAIQ